MTNPYKVYHTGGFEEGQEKIFVVARKKHPEEPMHGGNMDVLLDDSGEKCIFSDRENAQICCDVGNALYTTKGA